MFRLAYQWVASWAYFAGILSVVLYRLNVLWIDPPPGPGLGSSPPSPLSLTAPRL